MAAYARTPSALTWLHVNYLINGLHKQISRKNCLYAVNSYFTISKGCIMLQTDIAHRYNTRTVCYSCIMQQPVVSTRGSTTCRDEPILLFPLFQHT